MRLAYDIKPTRIKEISFTSKYNYYEALVGLYEPQRIINLKAITPTIAVKSINQQNINTTQALISN